MTRIADYQCFRDDRSTKIGGGVAIWAHISLSPHVFELENKPISIEAIAVCLMSYLYVICVYIPPIVSSNREQRDVVLRFLTISIDKLAYESPKAEILLCGDFNRFPVYELCNECNLHNMFSGITYNTSQLDYMLMTENLSTLYRVTVETPIDNSKISHVSLLATPQSSQNDCKLCSSRYTLRTAYDMRESNVRDFVNCMQHTDWSLLYDNAVDLDAKTEYFHYALNEAFALTIPSSEVLMNETDKPWMTRMIRSLINLR